MGYVAAKGGTQAILNAEQLVEYFRLRGGGTPITVQQIRDQLRLAVDRAMNEGSLYAPDLAALALKQGEGDAIEASFLLRAYRSTLPRLTYSLPVRGETMRTLRRISANFKDIPGGQMLGPTRDYQLRLLNTTLSHETTESIRAFLDHMAASITPLADDAPVGVFPKVVEMMRDQGVLVPVPASDSVEREAEPFDITRQAISFPAPRSARLQTLARGDVGSLLTFAYSSVRGYGDAHPTLAELRVGHLPVTVSHPLTGEEVHVGEIMATECEIASKIHTIGTEKPMFSIGYGFAFGQSEVKAISMSIIDRVLSSAREHALGGESGPSANEEFVLLHCDNIESSGFTAHYKLPHYVAYQADVRVLERDQQHQALHDLEKQAYQQAIAEERPDLFAAPTDAPIEGE